MIAKNTFQKFFFGLIFLVTIIMFIQMYSNFKSNSAKIECLSRSKALLNDLRLTDIETISLDSAVSKRDSIIYHLSSWGEKPGFYGFQTTSENGQSVERILVSRHAVGNPNTESEARKSEPALEITWRRLATESEWNSQVELISVELDTLYHH